MATIQTKVESERGCGYRKKGGLYICSDGVSNPCGLLPFELTVCPCCGEGIKQTRGLTWITAKLFSGALCKMPEATSCIGCPMNFPEEKKLLLMWVGEKFYPTCDSFTREAMSKGVSKRIAQVPHGFKVGETWILLAHPKGMIPDRNVLAYVPAIFYAFIPKRIEYIVTGHESETELNAMEKRGITLINVVRDIDQQTKMELKA